MVIKLFAMNPFNHQSGEYFETTDAAKIYYEITGNPDGLVLVLLHGGFGNMEDFNGLLPVLPIA